MTLELFPDQIEGAQFLAGGNRRALFDPPGYGKCAETIHALDLTRLRRGVIVAPAAIREVWLTEFKKFSALPRRIIKGTDINHLNLWLRGKVDVILLSYQMAAKWAKRMEGDVFDFLICDEAHYLRNKGTSWTMQILGAECDGKHGLARWAAYTWFLTGSPNYNDPVDIWSILRFCRATRCSRAIFADRYFRKRVGTYTTSHTVRDETLEELKLAIKSCSIRRPEREGRPPIWLTSVNVAGDTTEIKALLRLHPGLDEAILEAVERGGLSFLDSQHVMTLRRLVGEAKAVPYAELMAEEFRGGRGKTIIGFLHTRAADVIAERLRSHGIKTAMFRGDTSETARAKFVKEWADDPDFLAGLVQLRAGGEGQTFVAGNEIDLFESGWTPVQNAQFFKRVHRTGQTRDVHGRYITLSNSIDDRVAETVLRKAKEIMKLGTFSDIAA